MYRVFTKWILIAIAALLVLPVRAAPVQVTAKTLFDSCSSDMQSVGYAGCRRYMMEFVRRARPKISEGNWGGICVPPDITSDEVSAAFVHVARSREDFPYWPIG